MLYYDTINERKEINYRSNRFNYIKNSYVLYPLISITYKKEKDKLNIYRFDAFCTAKSSGHQLFLEKEDISEIFLTANIINHIKRGDLHFLKKIEIIPS